VKVRHAGERRHPGSFSVQVPEPPGFRRNDDNNSRLQSPNSESLGLVMIQQPGCISEQLLRGRENSGEFISLSTWEDQASIDRYRASDGIRPFNSIPGR
jgi:hypothetical protein